jgi:tRNA threonylcarbamoyl adenosine modification protein YeaZ
VATDGRSGVVLGIDTATDWVVVGLARPDGTQLAGGALRALRMQGERLLREVEGNMEQVGVGRPDITGIVVGTGPGTFTGLRIGIATAKGLAHGLGVPIVGVSTADVLREAIHHDWTVPGFDPDAPPTDRPDVALLLPAGPQDRLLIHGTTTAILPPGADIDLPASTLLIAVDLAGRAPEEAIQRGESAIRGFAETLLTLGCRRLAAGETDDLAELVPQYVTLPRGVARQTGEVEWSRDPR